MTDEEERVQEIRDRREGYLALPFAMDDPEYWYKFEDQANKDIDFLLSEVRRLKFKSLAVSVGRDA